MQSLNAQDCLDSQDLVIPTKLPVNMLVIVRPNSENQNELFWLGIILFLVDLCLIFLLGKVESGPNGKGAYKLRYYKCNTSTSCWAPGQGKLWSGTCKIGGVLLAGVNLTEKGRITAKTMSHINYILANDV